LKPVALSEHLASALLALRRALRRHPRRVTGSLAALLLGTGVTAFGVAPLAPDAADLPVTQVLERVEPLPVAPQADALLDHRFALYRTEVTRSSDTAESLLRRLNIADPAAAAFLRRDVQARSLLLGRAGRTVTAEADDEQRLLRLSVRWATDDEEFFKRLVIEREGTDFAARIESAPYRRSSRLATGLIKTSLFAATDEAGLPDAIAIQIAEIFSGDIDFHRSLRKGDRFSVLYEALEADGEILRVGRVLTTEFVNGGKTLQAMWFRDESQTPGPNGEIKGAYYNLDGKSLRRAYLASPMEFSRVTSGFKMRLHPIHRTWKAHLGVDYGAPVGTPVRVVGDGVVEFAGTQGGFGNVIFVNHGKGHTTVYAHLSRMNVSRGERVAQGQHIGAVGATGWATGPHLHFEFRINGVHQDPLMVARRSENIPLSASALPAFRQMASLMRQQLDAAGAMQQSRAE
jgi:murein DD-endopeptidase MepM/ murein hydrolase activator NlpD